MGKYVSFEIVKLMIQKDIKVKGSSILVLGITFKENCPDVRNTKAVDVITNLTGYGINVDVYDPWASKKEVQEEYGLGLLEQAPTSNYDVIVLCVSHNEFLSLNLSDLKNEKSLVYDVKGVLEGADQTL